MNYTIKTMSWKNMDKSLIVSQLQASLAHCASMTVNGYIQNVKEKGIKPDILPLMRRNVDIAVAICTERREEDGVRG